MSCPLCRDDWGYLININDSTARYRPGQIVDVENVKDADFRFLHWCPYLNGDTRFPEGAEL